MQCSNHSVISSRIFSTTYPIVECSLPSAPPTRPPSTTNLVPPSPRNVQRLLPHTNSARAKPPPPPVAEVLQAPSLAQSPSLRLPALRVQCCELAMPKAIPPDSRALLFTPTATLPISLISSRSLTPTNFIFFFAQTTPRTSKPFSLVWYGSAA